MTTELEPAGLVDPRGRALRSTPDEEAFRDAVAGKTKEQIAQELRDGIKLEALRLEWLNANLYAWPAAGHRRGVHIVDDPKSFDGLCGAEVVHRTPDKADLKPTKGVSKPVRNRGVCPTCKDLAAEAAKAAVPDLPQDEPQEPQEAAE